MFLCLNVLWCECVSESSYKYGVNLMRECIGTLPKSINSKYLVKLIYNLQIQTITIIQF